MAIPILVVDASPGFGDLIRQTLEETGRYQVTVTESAAEALEVLRQVDIRLAIVDFGLSDLSGPEAVRRFHQIRPDLEVIGIPVSDGDLEQELDALELAGVLSKPFYVPDLPAVVAQALGLSDEEIPPPAPRRPGPIADAAPAASEPPPPWLADSDRAGEYLARLSMVSSAEAALLTRGRRLWAYTGRLEEAQLQELISMIADSWAREAARGCLARFVRLPGCKEDFMLYATRVAGDLVLGLVFGAETPFGTIRRQASSLARALSSIDPDTPLTGTEPPVETPPEEAPGAEEEVPPLPADWIPLRPPSAPIPQAEAGIALMEQEAAEAIHEEALPLTDQLAGLHFPPPDPEPQPIAAGPAAAQAEPASEAISIPKDWLPVRPRLEADLPFLETITGEGPTRVVEGITSVIRPLPEAEYQLSFTAVLIPLFPEHRLEGELARHLEQWVQRLCLAWDWRADRVQIYPECLCVTLSLLPEVAPAGAVRQLRDGLTMRILQAFPHLAEDLPSGRFWARGYLLTAGAPPSLQRIRDFIRETRNAQGLPV